MGAFLVVQRSGEIGRRVDLLAQLTIGHGPDNDLALDDPAAARYHAVVKCNGTGCTVTDLGAAAPTVGNDRVLGSRSSSQAALGGAPAPCRWSTWRLWTTPVRRRSNRFLRWPR